MKILAISATTNELFGDWLPRQAYTKEDLKKFASKAVGMAVYQNYFHSVIGLPVGRIDSAKVSGKYLMITATIDSISCVRRRLIVSANRIVAKDGKSSYDSRAFYMTDCIPIDKSIPLFAVISK